MKDFLAIQLSATQIMLEAEEKMEEMVKLFSSRLPAYERVEAELTLREFMKVCISYGRLQSTHEKYLSDGKKES